MSSATPVVIRNRGDRRRGSSCKHEPSCDPTPRSIAAVLLAAVWRGIASCSLPTSPAARSTSRRPTRPPSNKYLPETMGGGVALLDYDNDGRLDIFFVNGAKIDDPMPPGSMPDKSDRKFWNRLYHQNPDGTFTDVTEKAGLTGMPQNRYGMGVAVGDFDNDGFEDLYVTGFGGNTLYRNNGDGTFTDVTERARAWRPAVGAPAPASSTTTMTASSICLSRAISNWSFDDDRFCGEHKPGGRAYCHPDNFHGHHQRPLPQQRRWHFHRRVPKRPASPTPRANRWASPSPISTATAGPTSIVANDSVQCFLYRNNHDGTFTDVALTAGVGFNEDGKTFAGMGVDFADYDNDGRPDIIVTDLSDQRYLLYRNKATAPSRTPPTSPAWAARP